MRVLFVGTQRKGSWLIRAEQICGYNPGWRCSHSATDDMVKWADVVVVVKRAPPGVYDVCLKFNKPLVWDVLDSWQQPAVNTVRDRVLLQDSILKYQHVIFPCQRMMDDFSHHHGVVIYHHHRPILPVNPIRSRASVVAYEGRHPTLGSLEPQIAQVCSELSLRLVVNPRTLADADIVIAARDEQHSDPLSVTYKSNVKMANAIGSGTPFMFQPEPSYIETCPLSLPYHPFWNSLEDLKVGLGCLASDYDIRRRASEALLELKPVYSISAISRRYHDFLSQVLLRHQG